MWVRTYFTRIIKINSGKEKILNMFNVDIKKMINSINTKIKTSGGTLNLGHLPLTRRAERILGILLMKLQ